MYREKDDSFEEINKAIENSLKNDRIKNSSDRSLKHLPEQMPEGSNPQE